MIPYEEFLPLLPHEYSYALYLSYGFDLCMYDPMILNMVSERYPRDEDYASDADSDSDSVTDEDFSNEISPWLFLDLEEEDASLLPENNRLEILFGNFNKDSDLETISIASLVPVEPEFDGLTIKIGEITCLLTEFKRSDDGSPLEYVGAPRLLDLDSNTTHLQLNTTIQEIKTDCGNCTKEEAGMDLTKTTGTLAEDIPKKEIIAELNDSSIAMTDFTFMAAGKSTDQDLVKQLQERTMFSEIVPLPYVFNNDAASRSFTNLVFSISSSVTWFDFIFRSPFFIHRASFASGFGITASSPKKQTEHLLAENATPRLTTFTDPGGTIQEISYSPAEFSFQSSMVSISFPRVDAFVFNRSVFIWFDFVFTAPKLNVSLVEDGYKASMERRKMKVLKRKSQPPPCKPPYLSPRELPGSRLLLWIQNRLGQGRKKGKKGKTQNLQLSGPNGLEPWASPFQALLIWFELKSFSTLVWADTTFSLC